MNTLEKCLLAADIIFAVLSLWFLFPQCKASIWQRFIYVVLVYAINALAFYYDDNVMWLFVHTGYFVPLCHFVGGCAICGWFIRQRRLAFRKMYPKMFNEPSDEKDNPIIDNGRTEYNNWSDNFDKRHPRLIWCIVITMLLLIPIIAYWAFHW